MNLIKQEFLEAKHVLDSFIADENHFSRIENAAMLMVKALQEGHKIISCGNGGSMCDAMHFAEELTGQFRNSRRPMAALSISDPTHMSCTANDFGYEHIFSRYVEAIGQAGDVLLAISTSGNSDNVVTGSLGSKNKGNEGSWTYRQGGGQAGITLRCGNPRSENSLFRPYAGNSYQGDSFPDSLHRIKYLINLHRIQ